MRQRPIRDAVRSGGIAELAQRLLNAARRLRTSESDAEELVRDGFARCFVPQQPGRRFEVSTTYSREFEDIVARCARERTRRTEEDERRINSFVCRLTLTTHRHLMRKQGQRTALAAELAQQQCAVLASIEDELVQWSEDEQAITRVLDTILTEIARKGDTPLGNALKDRLRSEFAEADERATSHDIAAQHGVQATTLRSSWHHLLITLVKRKQRC